MPCTRVVQAVSRKPRCLYDFQGVYGPALTALDSEERRAKCE